MIQLRRSRRHAWRMLWPHAQAMPACGHTSAGGRPWPPGLASLYSSADWRDRGISSHKTLQFKTLWPTQACTIPSGPASRGCCGPHPLFSVFRSVLCGTAVHSTRDTRNDNAVNLKRRPSRKQQHVMANTAVWQHEEHTPPDHMARATRTTESIHDRQPSCSLGAGCVDAGR